MAWHWSDNIFLSVTLMIHFTDAYMGNQIGVKGIYLAEV